MLPPIRPRPITPSCIVVSCRRRSSPQSFLDGRLECRETCGDVGPEMETKHPAPTFGQHFEIAPGFCRLDDSEGVFLAGNREIIGVIARDLQEDAAVGPALVGLPGRVQKARAEPKAGRDALAVAHKPSDFLERLSMQGVALDVGKQREIVSFAQTAEMLLETGCKRASRLRRAPRHSSCR